MALADRWNTVIAACEIAAVTRILPTLVELGWTSPSVLAAQRPRWSRLDLTDEETSMLQIPLATWLETHQDGPPKDPRRDLPKINPSTGGSLKRALESAQANQSDRTLKSFREDIWARSNSHPHNSRVKTWETIARAWHVPPWPLTPDLIEKVGASLKAGGYKSAKLYFSAARREHVVRHGDIPVEVELSRKDAVRSIERGLGPSKLKDSFDLTLLRTLWDLPDFQRIEDDYIMVLSGSWFLMREIELANARASHVRFEHTSSDHPVVHWSLPVSKTDTKGEMIERSHVCSCSAGTEPLCIVHALRRRIDKIELMTDRTPLFPDSRGHTRSKADTIKAIRNIIGLTGTETTRVGPNGRSLERFGGHSLRVAGSQFLAAHGVDTNTILLLGCWSSHAIQRYIQEASLLRPCRPLGHPETPDARPSFVRDTDLAELRTKLESLAKKVASLNTPPKYVVIRKAHLPDPRENGAVPAEWRTKCGRPYGLTRFRRSDRLDQPCRQCFPDTPEAAGASSETEVMDRQSDESETSSTSSDSE